MTTEHFYITTPIYYVNDVPHIGHGYTTLAADVMARFNRLDGKDVMFLTGTDEHGQKVEKSAKVAHQDPQDFTDHVSKSFRALAKTMNFSNDDFIRTTEQRHKTGVQALWKKLDEAGQIYLGSYAGWYAERDEAFYGEDELTITPDGKRIASSGAECAWVEEPSYFFKLSEWGDKLLAYYEAHPDFIAPQARRNEIISFVKGGLRDLSISRTSFTWGVKVPGDEKHIVYVWLDALANYMTALGYPDTAPGGNYSKFWPADVHLVGKDILRFHAVYWPAFLMAVGLPVPRRIFANGWWTAEGQKISKSLGNVIDPNELIKTYGLDQTRYFLLRAFPYGNDGDFSRKAMIERINGDLANGIGNLAQRTLSQVAKNCESRLPEIVDPSEEDDALLAMANSLPDLIRAELAVPAFHKALDAIFTVIGEADSYIDRQAPWALRKTDPARMAVVLAVLCRVLRVVATVLQPFMPDAMDKLLTQLGVAADQRDLAALTHDVQPGTILPQPQGIFPRYVEEAAVVS
jgi:methionyl-tRNA synthetase